MPKKLTIDMSDIATQMAKEKEMHRKTSLTNRQILRKEMESRAIDQIKITFDGCGDSGQFEEPEYYRKGNTKKSKLIQVTIDDKETTGFMVNNGMRFEDGKWVDNLVPGNLRDLVEDVFYRILEAEHGGWEINEGSFGTFTYDVFADEITLEFNERYQEVRESTETY